MGKGLPGGHMQHGRAVSWAFSAGAVRAVALLWPPSPMPALENVCTDTAGDQWEGAATLPAGF